MYTSLTLSKYAILDQSWTLWLLTLTLRVRAFVALPVTALHVIHGLQLSLKISTTYYTFKNQYDLLYT